MKFWRLGRGSSRSPQASSGGAGRGGGGRVARSWPRQPAGGRVGLSPPVLGERGRWLRAVPRPQCRRPPPPAGPSCRSRAAAGEGWGLVPAPSAEGRRARAFRGEVGSGRCSAAGCRPEVVASRSPQLPRCSALWKWREAGWVQAALLAKYRLARAAAPVLFTCSECSSF